MENLREFREQADLLKALAHPTRLCIVNGLLREEGCNVNRIKECLNLPQSTVSQQLAILRAAGIVEGERHGVEVCYRVVDDRAKRLVRTLMGDAEGQTDIPK
ncbi:MAG: ArsR family transcriptional regulator [Desulforudis sp.]|jgi:ArsR family transcriptional regulator|nr:metalloregulator ArsR/SmtB family transcription factor [Clostridia bacterium]MDQ7791573.1 metalloregulator ArsR/SmtB family transcription factor [Clostridia bacterium]RJX21433.1 MAG: ArsR family transcriptional regulator [Desulforudis sp.]